MTSGAFLNSAVGQADHRKEIFGDQEEEDVPRSPSIFSIAASDGLMSTMRPALEHLLWYTNIVRFLASKINSILTSYSDHIQTKY